MWRIVDFICFLILVNTSYTYATTHCQIHNSPQDKILVQDHEPCSSPLLFKNVSDFEIFIEYNAPADDLGTYAHRQEFANKSPLNSCFSNIKKCVSSYKRRGINDFFIDMSLGSLGLTIGIFVCYCFYIVIENQLSTLSYMLLPPLDSFDYAYSNFATMNLSSHIIPTNKMGNIISHLMVHNNNLTDDIHVLASYDIKGVLADKNLVYNINQKTTDLFLSHKYVAITRRIKTIFTRFCYNYEQNTGYTIESHTFNKKIPIHQHETIFEQNCPGLAIIMAKWPVKPFHLVYGGSSVDAGFDLKVIHPYQCLDDAHSDTAFTTHRRLLQIQSSETDIALQKVANDFKKTIVLHNILQEIVVRLNNNTCPGRALKK